MQYLFTQSFQTYEEFCLLEYVPEIVLSNLDLGTYVSHPADFYQQRQ